MYGVLGRRQASTAIPASGKGRCSIPGPTVDDLAAALVDIPLRNASQPIDVTLDGYAGKLRRVERAHGRRDGRAGQLRRLRHGDGRRHFFESWIGDPSGWGGDRYHQGPGQVDRLWILDVDGVRFVIDAALGCLRQPAEEREELLDVVESIQFKR